MRLKLKRKPKTPTGRQRILSQDSDQAPQGMAYYSKRAEVDTNTGRQLDRPKPKTKRNIKLIHNFWIQRFGVLILAVVLVVCIVSLLGLSSNPKIVVVGDAPIAPLHSLAVYGSTAHSILAGSIWNGNKITVDSASVTSGLKKHYPELTSVSVTLPLIGHRPIIYIESAAPSLMLASPYGNFVVDSNGHVLSQDNAEQTATQLSLPHVTDQSGLRPIVGQQVMTATTVSFINTVNTEFIAKRFQPSVMVLPSASSELDVHLVGQPYFIKFNLETGDARQQSGTFLATQAHLSSQGVTPAQYIDVRVEGRAYYK